MRAENSITCWQTIALQAGGEFHYMRAESQFPSLRRIPFHAGGESPSMRAETSITCGELSTEGHDLVLNTQHMNIWCLFLVFLNFVGLLLTIDLKIYFCFDYI
jgi:hypothetical protein